MNSSEIRSRFLNFFKKRSHSIIPSASLITTDEKGVTNPTLFNTAGMQPLIPYLLGEPYLIDGKETKRLANVQKCLRTVDIDDIGDNTHATFFEMLGNWSLGDYFKKEAIAWSYEFLTSKEEGLGLDPNRLYITVFDGDGKTPRDLEATQIWQEIFKANLITDSDNDTLAGKAGKIFYLRDNWWEAGDNGPCGPDSEMYYDISNKFSGRGLTISEFQAADQARDIVEIWNDVFMQYEKRDGMIIGKLPKSSVDTGAGLERLSITLQNVSNIYETDLLKPIMNRLNGEAAPLFFREKRIIADHLRASAFLISDGVTSANTGRGYILRRLLRRAARYAQTISLKIPLSTLIDSFQGIYDEIYPNFSSNLSRIKKEIDEEVNKFNSSLERAMKEFDKMAENDISGHEAFKLFSTYGLPIDTIVDIAKEKGIKVDISGYDEEFKKHQARSRSGAEMKFKGGLADHDDPMIVRYHTVTHLLHEALHEVLGDMIAQKGSNITAERLRFDFSYSTKMTDEEKKKVEEIVNSKIAEALPVRKIVMTKDEAEKTSARHFFGEKYSDQISIYYIGGVEGNIDSAFSKEFCGGPHVSNTSELAGPEGKWKFKILKEEAVASGIRRIKAVLSA